MSSYVCLPIVSDTALEDSPQAGSRTRCEAVTENKARRLSPLVAARDLLGVNTDTEASASCQLRHLSASACH